MKGLKIQTERKFDLWGDLNLRPLIYWDSSVTSELLEILGFKRALRVDYGHSVMFLKHLRVVL